MQGMDRRTNDRIVEQVVEELRRLPHQAQQRVLDFTRGLSAATPRGASGADLLRFAGSISVQDADDMRAVIEEGCERIDESGW